MSAVNHDQLGIATVGFRIKLRTFVSSGDSMLFWKLEMILVGSKEFAVLVFLCHIIASCGKVV